MRYQEKSQITISDDISNQPLSIRFAELVDEVDITSLKTLLSRSDSWLTGTFSIDLGQLTAAKFLWIKPVQDIQINLDGQLIGLKAGKASKLWTSFTALSIIVPSSPQNLTTPVAITIAIGG